MIRGERGWGFVHAGALLAAALGGIALLADCGGGATCASVCDNVLSKCSDPFSTLAQNQCVEQCSQRVVGIPASCAAQRDAVLGCIADAPSVDCADPQRTAACTAENQLLANCMGGGSTSGQGGVTTGTSGGGGCSLDKDCTTGLCNTQLGQCSTPGPDGTPCNLSKECAGGLCNTQLQRCSPPGALGSPCNLSKECASGLCNTKLQQCSTPGAPGSPCNLGTECASGNCNGQTCS